MDTDLQHLLKILILQDIKAINNIFDIYNTIFENIDFAGYKGYYIDKHLYLIDQNLNNDAIAAIILKLETDRSFSPENVVLFGYNFKWTELEALKTNLIGLKYSDKNLHINFDIRY